MPRPQKNTVDYFSHDADASDGRTLSILENNFGAEGYMAWVSPAGTGRSPWGFCCWQPILVYGTDPYLKSASGRQPDAFVSNETTKELRHPCAKPIVLWQKLLHRYSRDSTDVILDPFMGSGTTLVAAKKLGRRAIGIEIEPKYCQVAVERLRQSVMNLSQPVDGIEE